jgi:oligosaccharide repeat unit polymerase
MKENQLKFIKFDILGNPVKMAGLIAILLSGSLSLIYSFRFFEFVKPETFISVALFGLSVFIFFGSYLYYKDVFSPTGLMGGTWFFALGVTSLRLSKLQQPWDSYTWFVFIISAFSFLAGAFLCSPLIKDVKFSWDNIRVSKIWSRQKYFLSIFLLFGICLFVYFIEAKVAGGVPLLAKDKTEAYGSFGITFIHYITVSILMVPALCYFYIKTYIPPGERTAAKLVLIGLSMFSFIAIVTLMSKNLIFHMILFLVLFANYIRKKKISLKYILIFMLIVLIGMISLAEIRFASDVLVKLGQLDLPPGYQWAAMPYIYLALNFENMNQVININPPVNFTVGSKTLAPLWIFSMYSRVFKDALTSEGGSGHLVEENFNVSTYLEAPYKEYGLPGVIIFPFIYGGITQIVYLLMRKTGSPLFIGIYCVVANAAAFSFFDNFYAHPTSTFFIIVLVLIHFFSKETVK